MISQPPMPAGAGRVLDHLNRTMIEFTGRMESAFMATADDSGECDCSLRSGPPGFVRVLDDRTMAYPAGRGEAQRRTRIGLLMMDTDLTGLHVSGTASVVADSVLRGEHPDLPGGTAEKWVLVRVVEAFAVGTPRPESTPTA